MRLPVRVALQAEEDIFRQAAWYEDRARPGIVARFLAALELRQFALANNPQLGRPRHFRSPALAGLRSLALREGFGAHLLFYRLHRDEIELVRVIHGARDLEAALLEPLGE